MLPFASRLATSKGISLRLGGASGVDFGFGEGMQGGMPPQSAEAPGALVGGVSAHWVLRAEVSDPDAQNVAGARLLDSDGNKNNPKHNEARRAAACIGGSRDGKSEKPTVSRAVREGSSPTLLREDPEVDWAELGAGRGCRVKLDPRRRMEGHVRVRPSRHSERNRRRTGWSPRGERRLGKRNRFPKELEAGPARGFPCASSGEPGDAGSGRDW